MTQTSSIITIRGLVQGVGFRPAVFRIANELGITGRVENTNENVVIHACGPPEQILRLIQRIKAEHPVAASIDSIREERADLPGASDFRITPSRSISSKITKVSSDIAVCPECLNDMERQKHRLNYPLINCTHCGPRFSIIHSLPYDRPRTSMKDFKMCPDCRQEYDNPENRRFHAQPIACNSCGPAYFMHYQKEKITEIHKILSTISSIIENGGIVALKGTGGYNLICDAFSREALQKLRFLKKRDHKPFALMGRSSKAIREHVFINKFEHQLLNSWRRPIVLLKEKRKTDDAINPGLNHLGILLPYMPFHYQLFKYLKTDLIVFTSGNKTDEPIVISDLQAVEQFLSCTNAVVGYNREIHNRVDDSIVFVSNNKSRIIRRSRGYAPTPLQLDFNCEGIAGAGAELTNTFCIGKDREAILSQHIGDLKNPATYAFYEESFNRFEELFRFRPKLIACDLHPDYLSTRFAESRKIPLIRVQHHHAHIASVMAEHHLNEKVIGISLDGTGLGDDGHIWGGEFFICDLKAYERVNHYEYRPLPGGDKAVEEPWRNALGLLYHYFGADWEQFDIAFIKYVKTRKHFNTLIQAIGKNINSPLTSSAGRLFDAVAALLMICPVAKHHAEAPMLLEANINGETIDAYSFSLKPGIDLKPLITELIHDIEQRKNRGYIITKFHNTIVSLNFRMADQIRKERNINKVVLSGGVFQNRYIVEKTEDLLAQNGFETFSNQDIPANDAGISLGQLAIAANQNQNQSSCV